VPPIRIVKNNLLVFRNGVTYIVAMPRRKMPQAVKEYFIKMGRKGGRIGGKARAAKLTDEERSESARRAVMARWAKRKEA
jgi:hypothetical protein